MTEFYHATPADNLEHILSEGLKVDSPNPIPWEGGGSRRRGIHFAQGVHEARQWGAQVASALRDDSWERSANNPELDDYPMDEAVAVSILKLKNPQKYNLTHQEDKQTGLKESYTTQNIHPDDLEHVENIHV